MTQPDSVISEAPMAATRTIRISNGFSIGGLYATGAAIQKSREVARQAKLSRDYQLSQIHVQARCLLGHAEDCP